MGKGVGKPVSECNKIMASGLLLSAGQKESFYVEKVSHFLCLWGCKMEYVLNVSASSSNDFH